MDLLDGDVELTEFEAMDVESIKGVGQGANGFPILIMKGLAAPVVKGKRDCPKCDKPYDADHKGSACENCGADLPDADASKAADDGDKKDCPTCKGDGKIMGGKRDCPDCDATGKVTPAKAKQLAAKSLVRAIIAKAVGDGGQVDEAPDIAGGTDVLARIADLIIAEATELKAGQAGEIADILQLACAAEAIWCWRTGEEAVGSGSVMPATALSDGSYPIADEHDLKSAAILAQSGHGDVEGAKRLIGRRAKELGVKNPLDDGKDDTAKGAIAQEDTSVDTVVKGTGDLQKAVEDAVTKAVRPLEERIKTLDAELAKVKATPVPGGPVLSRNVQVKAPGGVVREDWAAKAAYYREQAQIWDSQDRGTADGYRKMARDADAKAVTPVTT